MARFGTALILLAATSAASAFSPNPSFRNPRYLAATANEDTDFDAPMPMNPQNAGNALDHEIVVVDDECYLGKYGQYPDCVDFGECILIALCVSMLSRHLNWYETVFGFLCAC